MLIYLIILVTLIIVGVVLYFSGRKAWGKPQLTRCSAAALRFYILINLVKQLIKRVDKSSYLLNLNKVHDYIVSSKVTLHKAQKVILSRTSFKLKDIYDDKLGHRYIKINTAQYGELIFEIKQYFAVVLNKRLIDRVLANAPADKQRQTTINELNNLNKPDLRLL